MSGQVWYSMLTLPPKFLLPEVSHHPPSAAKGSLEATEFSPPGAWDGTTGQHLLAVPAPGKEAGHKEQGRTQGMRQSQSGHRRLCLPCAGWSRQTPSQAMPGLGLGIVSAPNRLLSDAHAVVGRQGNREGNQEGNQPSHRAAWPQAGGQLPAGSAAWQGCSHQRPPTTSLKLSLSAKPLPC